ncbi:hypothetical protein MNBD_ALPHA12-1098 [hydrothermal vent metagenome]|uniref:DUF1761 domain-containing protein n=1 Tax=hydrothermal vent metagenome TaxID=652676 RepID=A0A3B0T6I5_9ZZZZ
MLTLNVNWMAIVLATLASTALGMGWYMVLSKQWVAATGKKQEDLVSPNGRFVQFGFAAASQFVMAYFIAVLTPLLMGGVINPGNAVWSAIYIWAGFVITTMIINHRYQNMSWKLTLIDGGYLLAVLVLDGIIIGQLG